MIGRLSLWALALTFVLSLPAASLVAPAGSNNDLAARREEDVVLVSTLEDDGGDDNSGDNSRSGYTSGVNSNDRTGSGHSAVSRDGERSRGDLTRDRTRDGAGARKRDWSGNRTNDRSRNDTR